MASNLLTDTKIRSAESRENRYKLSDGGGLYLMVPSTGRKVWGWGYRWQGKQKTLTFGTYPAISLARARTERDKARGLLDQGIDPGAQRERAPVDGMTLQTAIEKYFSGRDDLSQGYRDNATRGLTNHLTELLDRPMASITREHLMVELNRMNAAGLHTYVRKVRRWVSQVFDWAIENREETRCAENPADTINPKKAFGSSKVQHRAALELNEVAAFMKRLSCENQDNGSVLACMLLAYTWVRTKELRMMKWSELDGSVWRLPDASMKKDRDHLVPLSRQAIDVLVKMKARSRGSEYVFPAEHRLDRPMSENAILYLLYSMGYKDRMTGHGWRSVASTWANEHEYNADAIEYQLSHVKEDVRGIYNRAKYWSLRVKMLQDWADYLEGQIDPSCA